MKTVLEFLKDLEQNNNRDWFALNKNRYEEAKAQHEVLVTDILTRVAKWDAGIADLQAKDCTYRIYRDVRFSKDKAPYKISMGALISKGGRKAKGAINYVHIEPGKSFVAGGSYLPETAALKAIRQEIDYNLNEFLAIINDPDFVKHFGALETEWKGKLPPKGYSADNPAIEWLKYKGYIASQYFTDKQICAHDFAAQADRTLMLLKPLNDFINRALRTDE